MRIDKDIKDLRELTKLLEKMKQLSEQSIRLNQMNRPCCQEIIDRQFDEILHSVELSEALKDVYIMAEAFISIRVVSDETIAHVRNAQLSLNSIAHEFCD